MSYLKNQEFLGLLNLMSQKPSRMDDAYLVYQVAKYAAESLDGDIVLIEPDLWMVRLVELCTKSSPYIPKVHVVSRFNPDTTGSMDEFKLMVGPTVLLHNAMESQMDLGSKWSFVYLGDPWLSEKLAPHIMSRMISRGKLVANSSCSRVSYLSGFPGVMKIELSNHQVLYFFE